MRNLGRVANDKSRPLPTRSNKVLAEDSPQLLQIFRIDIRLDPLPSRTPVRKGRLGQINIEIGSSLAGRTVKVIQGGDDNIIDPKLSKGYLLNFDVLPLDQGLDKPHLSKCGVLPSDNQEDISVPLG